MTSFPLVFHSSPDQTVAWRDGAPVSVRAFLAGGVPEVMLHLRGLNLLDLSVVTVTGEPLEEWPYEAAIDRLLAAFAS